MKNGKCSLLSLTFHFWTFYSRGHNTPSSPHPTICPNSSFPHDHNCLRYYIYSGLLFCNWWLQSVLLLVELPWFYTNLTFRIFSNTDCRVMFSELQVCPFVSRFWRYVGCFPSHYNLNLFKSRVNFYISYIYSLSAPLASSLYPQWLHLITLCLEWILGFVVGEQ